MFNLYDIHIKIIAPTHLHKTQINSLLYETCHLQSQKNIWKEKKMEEGNIAKSPYCISTLLDNFV